MARSSTSQMGAVKGRWHKRARLVELSLRLVDKRGHPQYHPKLRKYCMQLLAAHSLLSGPENDLPPAAANAYRYVALYDAWADTRRAENLELISYVKKQKREEVEERFCSRRDGGPALASSDAEGSSGNMPTVATPADDSDDEVQIIAEVPSPQPQRYVDPETRCVQLEDREELNHFLEAVGCDEIHAQPSHEHERADHQAGNDSESIIVLDD